MKTRVFEFISGVIAFSLIISACNNLGVSPYYELPGIPIKLSVDMSGAIKVAFSEELEIQTPIGVFGIDIDLHTPELAGKKVLAVRMNNLDTVYDLSERDITTIELVPGYYQAINLQLRDNMVILELVQSEFNPEPVLNTTNQTMLNIKNQTEEVDMLVGRRSCSQTAFTSGKSGVVIEDVRLRHEPYIPQDLNQNWIGSLQKGETIRVLEINCNEYGTWLYVERYGGEKGWAKEWGLSPDLIENTYIAPVDP
jgi:hypothetical protein